HPGRCGEGSAVEHGYLRHRPARPLDVQDLFAAVRTRAVDLDLPFDDDVEPVARLTFAEELGVPGQRPRDGLGRHRPDRLIAQPGEDIESAQDPLGLSRHLHLRLRAARDSDVYGLRRHAVPGPIPARGVRRRRQPGRWGVPCDVAYRLRTALPCPRGCGYPPGGYASTWSRSTAPAPRSGPTRRGPR